MPAPAGRRRHPTRPSEVRFSSDRKRPISGRTVETTGATRAPDPASEPCSVSALATPHAEIDSNPRSHRMERVLLTAGPDGGIPRQRRAPVAGSLSQGSTLALGVTGSTGRSGRAVAAGFGRRPSPTSALCHLADLAADLARRRTARSPRARRRWPPWTAVARSVVVGDRAGNVWAFHLGNGSAVAGLAGPHRWRSDRLDSVGDPRRQGHRQRVRRRRQRAEPRRRRLLRLQQFGQRALAAERPGPQRAARRAGVDGRGQPQRGELGGGPVAGPGRVRLQRRQRVDPPGVAVLHRRQRLHHAVVGRPLRQRADRGGRGR